MSLREYLQLLRDGKWWIAAGLLFGMLAGQLIAMTSVPSYVATTTLYFAGIEGGGEPGQVYQGALLGEQKAHAYAQLIVSDRVLHEVANDTTSACRARLRPSCGQRDHRSVQRRKPDIDREGCRSVP